MSKKQKRDELAEKVTQVVESATTAAKQQVKEFVAEKNKALHEQNLRQRRHTTSAFFSLGLWNRAF